MAQTQGVIDPAVLDRLSNLELVARRVVEGVMAGQHRSPHKGSSIEFAQHRQYAPGDELRRLDWRVFARSDRLVVKEYVEETSLSLNLLLDASESMGFRRSREQAHYARWCAAALSTWCSASGTRWGSSCSTTTEAKVLPGNGAPQKLSIFRTLEETRAEGRPPPAAPSPSWLHA